MCGHRNHECVLEPKKTLTLGLFVVKRYLEHTQAFLSMFIFSGVTDVHLKGSIKATLTGDL